MFEVIPNSAKLYFSNVNCVKKLGEKKTVDNPPRVPKTFCKYTSAFVGLSLIDLFQRPESNSIGWREHLLGP